MNVWTNEQNVDFKSNTDENVCKLASESEILNQEARVQIRALN